MWAEASYLVVLRWIQWQITSVDRKIEAICHRAQTRNSFTLHKKTAYEDKLPTNTHTGTVTETKNSHIDATVC